MTLNSYKSSLNLEESRSYFIELSHFINLKGLNGSAILCEQPESNLYVSISMFYKCEAEECGACVYYTSNSTFITKCSQLHSTYSKDRAPTIYTEANDFQCQDTSMDLCKCYRACFSMLGEDSLIRSLNISNTKIGYQVGGFITRCIKNDIKFITLTNILEKTGCTIVFYFSEESKLSYCNVFNATIQVMNESKAYALLFFGNGAHVNIENSVFQDYNHFKIIGFYDKDNGQEEKITITNCVFDKQILDNFELCTTSGIQFTSEATYIITSVPYLCKVHGTQCICDQSMVHHYQLLIIIALVYNKT